MCVYAHSQSKVLLSTTTTSYLNFIQVNYKYITYIFKTENAAATASRVYLSVRLSIYLNRPQT